MRNQRQYPEPNLETFEQKRSSHANRDSLERLERLRKNHNQLKLDSSRIKKLNLEASAHIKKICGKINKTLNTRIELLTKKPIFSVRQPSYASQ